MIVRSPHEYRASGVAGVMRSVLIALTPVFACYVWLCGWGTIIHALIACCSALAFEVLALRLRGATTATAINALSDLSAPVLAILFAMAVPALAPWWFTVLGVGVAVLLGKHAYGGMGANVFNPAMAGYAFVMVCYPLVLGLWPVHAGELSQEVASLGGTLRIIFGAGSLNVDPSHIDSINVDMLSGATPLSTLRTETALMHMLSEMSDSSAFGVIGASGWEWINLAAMGGGFLLLARGEIRWQIPCGVIVGLFVFASAFSLSDPDIHASPMFHLFSGSTMLAAFFIATDPVTAPATPAGKLIFAFTIGALIYLIRTFGGYPDGVAFAILIMNAAVPTLNRLTRPRILGELS
jgi:electron transport complex protein RnfD